MPLYEYQCEKCGHQFEEIRKFSDPPVDACPSCAGPVRKLVSSPAFQFKGTGWYVTDYARAGQADKDKAAGDKAEGETKEKSEAAASTDKAEKADKAEQSDKTKKADKTEKTDKAAKPTDTKPAASSGSTKPKS